MIKVYSTEVEASEGGRTVFTVSLNEPDQYRIELSSIFNKASLDDLFLAIREAVSILEADR